MALAYPNIDPVAIQLGPVPIRWYSLGYIGGLALGWLYILQILKNQKLWPSAAAVPIKRDLLDDLIFWWVLLGVMVGGRLGYLLFYEPALLIGAWEPLGANMGDGWLKTLVGWLPIPPALMLWRGGMSFHGGFLGVLAAIGYYAWRRRVDWWRLMDFIAPLVPPGLAAGRLGNFINGELWGRTTDLPWGTVFRNAGNLPRHPSQLYQFALEGLLLFFLLWWYSSKPRARGAVSAMFLIGYGAFRFLAEFAREPDDFLGLLAFGLSMGQWLSLPMIAAGIGLYYWSQRQR